MNRIARRLFRPSVAAIITGVSIAMFGVLCGSLHIWRLGLLVAVAALPALCYALIHRAAVASDDQLAHAHRTGYQLALYHVSLGLLDTPAAPPDGGEGVGHADPQGLPAPRTAPGNVRPLRPRDRAETDNRKAV
jgi:hypothetical protein